MIIQFVWEPENIFFPIFDNFTHIPRVGESVFLQTYHIRYPRWREEFVVTSVGWYPEGNMEGKKSEPEVVVYLQHKEDT